MANHTAQLAIYRNGNRVQSPPAYPPPPPPPPLHPRQGSTWSDSSFSANHPLSPAPTTSQSIISDASDALETPTSVSSTMVISGWQPEIGVSMSNTRLPHPTSNVSQGVATNLEWRQPQENQYTNPHPPQSYDSQSIPTNIPYTVPDWRLGPNAQAQAPSSVRPNFAPVQSPSFASVQPKFESSAPGLTPSYSYGSHDAAASSSRATLGLGLNPGSMPTPRIDHNQGSLDSAFGIRPWAGSPLVFSGPAASAFHYNHSFTSPLSPTSANYAYEHGQMQAFNSEPNTIYNSVPSSSRAGPPTEILPAAPESDLNDSYSPPQSPIFQTPPQSPSNNLSSFPQSPDTDTHRDIASSNRPESVRRAPSAPRAAKTSTSSNSKAPSPTISKGKKGRKRYFAPPGEESAEWEGVMDKKERRRTQNRLAQRAFRARTRQQEVDADEAGEEGFT